MKNYFCGEHKIYYGYCCLQCLDKTLDNTLFYVPLPSIETQEPDYQWDDTYEFIKNIKGTV